MFFVQIGFTPKFLHSLKFIWLEFAESNFYSSIYKVHVYAIVVLKKLLCFVLCSGTTTSLFGYKLTTPEAVAYLIRLKKDIHTTLTVA